jgi:hypothetical protein
MTQEQATPQTAAMPPRDAFAPDPSELMDAELTYVVGGVGIENSIEATSKATPILM